MGTPVAPGTATGQAPASAVDKPPHADSATTTAAPTTPHFVTLQPAAGVPTGAYCDAAGCHSPDAGAVAAAKPGAGTDHD